MMRWVARLKQVARCWRIRIIVLTRRVRLPAGGGVRLYDVLMGLRSIWMGDNFDLRAFGMAFNFS